MEDVIRKIIKIEDKAQAIIEAANLEKEQKKKDFEEKLVALERRIFGAAQKKVSQLREREMSENDAECQAHDYRCNDKIKVMEAYAKEHESEWVEELVSSVLKR